jgi:hypothetical protein
MHGPASAPAPCAPPRKLRSREWSEALSSESSPHLVHRSRRQAILDRSRDAGCAALGRVMRRIDRQVVDCIPVGNATGPASPAAVAATPLLLAAGTDGVVAVDADLVRSKRGKHAQRFLEPGSFPDHVIRDHVESDRRPGAGPVAIRVSGLVDFRSPRRGRPARASGRRFGA